MDDTTPPLRTSQHNENQIQVERVALRAAEAANALGVSARTLQSWTRRGVIPSTKIDGVVLYPVDSLRKWLASAAPASRA